MIDCYIKKMPKKLSQLLEVRVPYGTRVMCLTVIFRFRQTRTRWSVD